MHLDFCLLQLVLHVLQIISHLSHLLLLDGVLVFLVFVSQLQILNFLAQLLAGISLSGLDCMALSLFVLDFRL